MHLPDELDPEEDYTDAFAGSGYDDEGEAIEDGNVEALVWQLLLLVNPGDEETALRQFAAYREAAPADEETDFEPMPVVADVIDWRSGFRVDIDDTAALVEAIEELASRWDLRIEWGGDVSDDEFMDGMEPHELMATAFDKLREYGYSLWTYDTGGESHAGFATLRSDEETIQHVVASLGVELRPASDAF